MKIISYDDDPDLDLPVRIRGRKYQPSKQRPEDIPDEIWGAMARLRDSGGEGFEPSYLASNPDSGERMWVRSALVNFYNDSLITDVLRVVKAGKEASVYCCEAHPATGTDLLAAKIYRPRLLRNLKNDALYKEGRAMLDAEGKPLRGRRAQVAMQKKTRFGSELNIQSWIEHEYYTLRALYQAGAAVPEPIAQDGKAILMEYIGDEQVPARALHQVRLAPSEAREMFDQVIHNIELMLQCNRIHADLSAYNILYADGEFKIIDFPQAVDPRQNPSGPALLTRDIERICEYFRRYGIQANARRLADDLWERTRQVRLEMPGELEIE